MLPSLPKSVDGSNYNLTISHRQTNYGDYVKLVSFTFAIVDAVISKLRSSFCVVSWWWWRTN